MNKKQHLNTHHVQRIRNASSLSDLTYDAIRDGIVTGHFMPGERLNQIDLASDLDVSPRTVREALNRLAAEGLAIYEPRKGFVTVQFSYEDQEDIFRMRASLEFMALDYAVPNITNQDLSLMRELLPRTAAAQDPAMVSQVHEINRKFHWIPLNASKRAQLIRMIDHLWKFMFVYYLAFDLTEDQTKRDLKEHNEILSALEAKDLEAVKEVWKRHLESNLEILKQRLEPN